MTLSAGEGLGVVCAWPDLAEKLIVLLVPKGRAARARSPARRPAMDMRAERLDQDRIG